MTSTNQVPKSSFEKSKSCVTFDQTCEPDFLYISKHKGGCFCLTCIQINLSNQRGPQLNFNLIKLILLMILLSCSNPEREVILVDVEENNTPRVANSENSTVEAETDTLIIQSNNQNNNPKPIEQSPQQEESMTEAPPTEEGANNDQSNPEAPSEVEAKPVVTDISMIDIPPIAENYVTVDTMFDNLSQGKESFEEVCSNSNDDRVKDGLCEKDLKIDGLISLQTALKLNMDTPINALSENGQNDRAFVFNFHSTSIVGEFVNEINPRCIVFTPENVDNPLFMGFTRGDQFVELIAEDRKSGNLNFYLLTFKKDCNLNNGACSLGERLTDEIEKDWIPSSVSIHTGQQLDNTPFMCSRCHDSGSAAIALMPELEDPWDHFFRITSSEEAIERFELAHQDDSAYCGIPIASVRHSEPFNLELTIKARQGDKGDQPLLFKSDKISKPSDKEWSKLFKKFQSGEFFAVPFAGLSIMTDEQVEIATDSYWDFVSGKSSDLVDYRTFRVIESEISSGHKFEDGADGQSLLTMACASCHNDSLSDDVTLSRTRFNVNALSNESIRLAIFRMTRAKDDLQLMPPMNASKLTESQIETLVLYLYNLLQ